MEFRELVQRRRSVRAYRKDPVDDALVTQVLEAARWAPTACNRQPFRLIVVRTAGRERELLRIYGEDWFVEAPLVICMCALPREAWSRRDGKNYADVDATIAMDHLILAAADLGLGTCWIAAFDPVAARAALALPPDVAPLAFTPLGHPADQPRPKDRRSLSELVRRERW